MAGAMAKLLLLQTLFLVTAASQVNVVDISPSGSCPPCIERSGKASCGCQIGRLEYEEGDVMRLRQFHWNNSLLWERKCRCGSGGVTGRNMMQDRVRRQSNTCHSSRHYFVEETTDGRGVNVTKADICFVVDESGSMTDEHAWLNVTVMRLEKVLKANGIAARFCLIGYGTKDHLLGEFIIKEGTASKVQESLEHLLKTGQKEDGYTAMYQVFNNSGNFKFNRNAAKIIVLVTDEDRDQLIDQPMSRAMDYDMILKYFTDNGVILNVVVNQYFKDDEVEDYVLGVDHKRRSYLYRNGSLLTGYHGYALFNGGHGNTTADYVSLSFKTNGSAWDLNQLRSGNEGQVTAFTEAFVAVKAREITSTLRTCEVCDCPDPTGQPVCHNDSSLQPEECAIEACFIDGQELRVGQSFYRWHPSAQGATGKQRINYVDLIFVIDESGSMEGDQSWFKRRFIHRINNHLQSYGIGKPDGRKNRIGLFGFAGTVQDQSEMTYLLIESTTEYERFDLVTFTHNGQIEDGYSAIKRVAEYLEQQEKDPSVQKMIVLVTDEDRDNVTDDITKDKLEEELRRADIRLDVVVSNSFRSADHRPAVGVGPETQGFPTFILGSGENDELPRYGKSIEDTGHGTTFDDYVDLAWKLCGVAWDINEVRADQAMSSTTDFGKDFARYFSKGVNDITCHVRQSEPQETVVPALCDHCWCQSNLRSLCTSYKDVSEEDCLNGRVTSTVPSTVGTTVDNFVIGTTAAPTLWPTPSQQSIFTGEQLNRPGGVEHDVPNPGAPAPTKKSRVLKSQAYRNQVCSRKAVKLMGYSVLSYDKQFFRNSKKTVISFCFKTIISSGVLMWVKQMRPRQAYILIQVMEGHVQARMDLGSGSEFMEHSQFVSDGQWHTALFRRKGNKVFIRLDGNKSVKMVAGKAEDKDISFRATGKWNIGMAGAINVNKTDIADPLTGCISNLKVNGNSVMLLNDSRQKVHVYTC